MGNIVTAIIRLWASGHDAKAKAAAPLSLIAGWLVGPEVLEAFRIGVQDGGLVPAAQLTGQVLGAGIYTTVQYLVSFWAPKNDD